MTFQTLKAELAARGFAHLSDARQGTYVNAARAELDRMYLWPYREASATGAAPLAISDLGPIEVVIDTSRSQVPLQKADWRSLVDSYGDLSVPGAPLYYYTASPSGTSEVATYPASSDTIGVQYWRVTPDLVNPGDSPASPAEFHYLIVDLAVRQAMNDVDNFFSASMVGQEIDRKIDQLLIQYPPGTQDGPDAYVGVTGASSDW